MTFLLKSVEVHHFALCEMAVYKKIRNIHRKTLKLEPLFNSEYWEIFKSTYFEGAC